MSQENIEVIRRAGETFNAGDLAAWFEFYDPEIDWRALEGAIDDVGEMHGTEALRRYVQDWTDEFEGVTVVLEELLEIGEDRVVAVQQLTGRARLSGIETQLRYVVLYTLRDGKIVRGREYRNKDEALRAAGLEG
jgi:ketosteroid isomerase-like protein